jgi:electron transport complex protein RnfG
MAQVMPDADSYDAVNVGDTGADSITAATKGGEIMGYCIELRSNGFGGDITLMVGVGTDGCVTGVQILDHSETAGMGAKADDETFLGQYIGRSEGITVKTGGDTDIDAITAATITSKAVTAGVNNAIEIALQIMG